MLCVLSYILQSELGARVVITCSCWYLNRTSYSYSYSLHSAQFVLKLASECGDDVPWFTLLSKLFTSQEPVFSFHISDEEGCEMQL